MTEAIPLPRRVLMRDPALPHQIVLMFVSHDIAVSCNCLRGADGGGPRAYAALEMRTHWEPGEALAVYRAHLAEAEVAS